MANTIQIKRGSSVPSLNQLESYELGYVNNGNLYIRETIKDNSGTVTSDKIVQLTGLAATGLVNTNNYLKLPAITSTTEETGRILVADSNGIVYYKTPDTIRSEIGAFSTSGGTIDGDLTISGKLTANGTIVVDADSYGDYDPNGVPGDSSKPAKDGVVGQLYFVVTG